MLTIYKASAGSGKTFTLAYEYIKLLLGERRPDGTYRLADKRRPARSHSGILAITFTNKATAEMKSRILKELYMLTRVPVKGQRDSAYAPKLVNEFDTTRAKIREAALRALRELLNDYGNFNVSTIDAFFQSVLRSFAHEIDRQSDYRLEMESDVALSEAMSMLFDEINLNPADTDSREIIEWLENEGKDRLREGKDYNPFHRGSRMYREFIENLKGIFNEDFAAKEKQMVDYLSDPQKLKDFSKWLTDEIDRMTDEEQKAASALLKTGFRIKPNPTNFLLAIASNGFDLNTYPLKWMKSTGYVKGMRESNPKDIFYASDLKTIPTSTIEALADFIKLLDHNGVRKYMYGEIKEHISTLWAIYHIYRFIERYRHENNLILISDTNSLLKTIIDGSDTPFIYEKVGNVLNNYLIDEFQDTSSMQWENLRPLVGNSLDTDDSLIIGDEKQSIYRWRGANPGLINKDISEIDFPRHSQVKGGKPGENTNYRSAHGIVRFNNTLFSRLAALPSCEVPFYEGVVQTPALVTKNLTSWVTVNNLRGDDFEQTALRMIGEEKVEDLKQKGLFDADNVALTAMAETILDQLNRGYRMSDIAVLYRYNNEGSVIAEFLGRNYGSKIKIISEEALLLRSSSAVRLIISILELIDRSLDNSAEAKAEMESVFQQSTLFADDRERSSSLRKYHLRRQRSALADSFEYYVAKDGDFSEALRKAIQIAENLEPQTAVEADSLRRDERPTDISSTLDDIRALAPANLAALVQAIIMLKVNDDVLKRELPYIAAFVDLVDEFMQNGTSSVHSFLAYWSENKKSLAIQPGEREDAVTLLTVHKAKGLEWKCVHIPLLGWDYTDNIKDGWFDMSAVKAPSAVPVPPIMYFKSKSRSTGFNGNYYAEGSPFKAQYDMELSRLRTDNVNIAYVAFTRPSRELYATILPVGKDEEKIGPQILRVLAGKSQPEAEKDKDEYVDFTPFLLPDGSLVMGSPTIKKEKEDSDRDENALEAPEFSISFDSLGDRLARVSEFVNASGFKDITVDDSDRLIVDDPLNQAMEEAARHGLLMHSILSQMRSLDDLDAALQRHATKTSATELTHYRASLTDAFGFAGEHAARWFNPDNPRTETEQSIFSRLTGRTTRADRIIWLPDGSVEIVDYKFTSQVRREHFEQVRDYAVALERMGYDVKAYLWYPLLKRIIPVEM